MATASKAVAPADLQTKLKAKLADAGVDQAIIDSVMVTEALTAIVGEETSDTTQAPVTTSTSVIPVATPVSVASHVHTSLAGMVALVSIARLL